MFGYDEFAFLIEFILYIASMYMEVSAGITTHGSFTTFLHHFCWGFVIYLLRLIYVDVLSLLNRISCRIRAILLDLSCFNRQLNFLKISFSWLYDSWPNAIHKNDRNNHRLCQFDFIYTSYCFGTCFIFNEALLLDVTLLSVSMHQATLVNRMISTRVTVHVSFVSFCDLAFRTLMFAVTFQDSKYFFSSNFDLSSCVDACSCQLSSHRVC